MFLISGQTRVRRGFTRFEFWVEFPDMSTITAIWKTEADGELALARAAGSRATGNVKEHDEEEGRGDGGDAELPAPFGIAQRERADDVIGEVRYQDSEDDAELEEPHQPASPPGRRDLGNVPSGPRTEEPPMARPATKRKVTNESQLHANAQPAARKRTGTEPAGLLAARTCPPEDPPAWLLRSFPTGPLLR